MTAPLIILAVLSVVGGYVGLPKGWFWGDRFAEFLAPVVAHTGPAEHAAGGTPEAALMAASVIAALSGIVLAYIFYVRSPSIPETLAARFRGIYQMLLEKYWVDELYGATAVSGTVAVATGLWKFVDVLLIDGLVNGVGSFVTAQSAVWRRLQTGNVQHYALSFLAGVIVIVAYFLMR